MPPFGILLAIFLRQVLFCALEVGLCGHKGVNPPYPMMARGALPV